MVVSMPCETITDFHVPLLVSFFLSSREVWHHQLVFMDQSFRGQRNKNGNNRVYTAAVTWLNTA